MDRKDFEAAQNPQVQREIARALGKETSARSDEEIAEPIDRLRRLRANGMAYRTRRRTVAVARYVLAAETWQRIGSYPNRKAAISAAYGEDQR